MPKYRVSAAVVGSKYIGEFEAGSEEEAIDKAMSSDAAYVSVCHQCSRDISDPELENFCAELIEDA